MTWFSHVCWYCGERSKAVTLLVSSMEYHDEHNLSTYQCEDHEACERRRKEVLAMYDSTYISLRGFDRHGEVV